MFQCVTPNPESGYPQLTIRNKLGQSLNMNEPELYDCSVQAGMHYPSPGNSKRAGQNDVTNDHDEIEKVGNYQKHPDNTVGPLHAFFAKSEVIAIRADYMKSAVAALLM